MLTPGSGIRTTVQFNSKVFSRDPKKPHLWCSTPLNNVDFNADKTALYADDCAMELSEDGATYTIKSMTDQRSIVNLKITRASPGWQAGKTGKTIYGTDLENPWGYIRHAFWPRCTAEGTITTPDGPVNFNGKALYIYGMQAMKPHHAGARWSFANFQGPNYSAIMMEFTTPPSYGSTKVNVACIAKDGETITAGCIGTVTHTAVKEDVESEWPEPTHVKFAWSGKTTDAKAVDATIEGSLGERSDRVDVMAEVPGFVKNIVAAAAGTKPYIYQVSLMRPRVCSTRAQGLNPESPESALRARLARIDPPLTCLVHAQGHAQVEDRGRGDHRGGAALQRGDIHLGDLKYNTTLGNSATGRRWRWLGRSLLYSGSHVIINGYDSHSLKPSESDAGSGRTGLTEPRLEEHVNTN